MSDAELEVVFHEGDAKEEDKDDEVVAPFDCALAERSTVSTSTVTTSTENATLNKSSR